MSSQHLSHQWFYEEVLKAHSPVPATPSYATAPLASSTQHILTDLGNAVSNVLVMATVRRTTIECFQFKP